VPVSGARNPFHRYLSLGARQRRIRLRGKSETRSYGGGARTVLNEDLARDKFAKAKKALAYKNADGDVPLRAYCQVKTTTSSPGAPTSRTSVIRVDTSAKQGHGSPRIGQRVAGAVVGQAGRDEKTAWLWIGQHTRPATNPRVPPPPSRPGCNPPHARRITRNTRPALPTSGMLSQGHQGFNERDDGKPEGPAVSSATARSCRA